MKKKNTQQDWRKGPARHLLRLIQGSFQLMDAYISEDGKSRVIIPDICTGRVIHSHQGPPTYDSVIQTYEATDEYLRHLGSFVTAGDIPRRDFNRLVHQRNILVKLCENKKKTGVSLGVI